MAIDKAVDSAVLDAGLTAIANAIREKAGTEGALAFPDGLVEAIGAIEGGVERGSVVTAVDTKVEDYKIYHSFGTIPKAVFIAGMFGYPYVKDSLIINGRWLSSNNEYENVDVRMNTNLTAAYSGITKNVYYDSIFTSEYVCLKGGSYMRAGYSYYYFII